MRKMQNHLCCSMPRVKESNFLNYIQMLKTIKITMLLFIAAIITQCKKEDEQPQPVFNPFTIEKNEVALTEGQTEVVKITSGNNDYKIIETQTSKNIAAATLTADKTAISITAKTAGETKISVIDNKVPDQIKFIAIKVSKQPNPFTLEKTALEVEVGKTAELNITSGNGDYQLTQTESSKAIATLTVSSTAQKITVNALAEGTATATITDVKTNNHITFTITVVDNTPKVFQLEKTELNIKIGETAQLKILNGKGKYSTQYPSYPQATISFENNLLKIKANQLPGFFELLVIDEISAQTASLTVYVTPHSNADFQLSADGTTLLKWTGSTTTPIDMNTNLYLSKVTTIGENAFANTQLERIFLTKKIKSIKNRAFYNTKVTYLALEETALTEIGAEAFKGTPIADIHLPNTLTTIGEAAFEGCKALTLNALPTQLTAIAPNTFANTGVTTMRIPQKVSSIGQGAFKGCDLKSIEIGATTPPTLAKDAIPTTIQYIQVPEGTANAYKAAVNWSDYANVID